MTFWSPAIGSFLEECQKHLLCYRLGNPETRPCPHIPVSPFFPSLSTPLRALDQDQESLLCHSLASSPWAGQPCVSRPQEFHLHNGE